MPPIYIVAWGEWHQRMAELSAKTIELATGIKPTIVDGSGRCDKLRVGLDDEQAMVVDADLVALSSWEGFPDVPRDRIACAPSTLLSPAAKQMGLSKKEAFNTGLIVYGRQHRALMEHACVLAEQRGLDDETALNVATRDQRDVFFDLPLAFNPQRSRTTLGDRAFHPVFIGGGKRKWVAMQHALALHSIDEFQALAEEPLPKPRRFLRLPKHSIRDDWMVKHWCGARTWVDIGAESARTSKAIEQAHGSDGWQAWDLHRAKDVSAFDGQRLPVGNDSAEAAVLSYVLHHSGLHLLDEAKRVARKWVVVAEDLRDGTRATDVQLYAHDPQGFLRGWFRTLDEWTALLSERFSSVVAHPLPLFTEQRQSYAVPRAIFVCAV